MILPLPFADTIPAVTVWLRFEENGLPTAITHSPTRSRSESPSSISDKFFAFIFITARSDFGSFPMTDALYSDLSKSRTVISSASSTT